MRASSGSMCVQRPDCAAGCTRLSQMFSAEDQSTGLVYKIGLHIRPVSTPDWSGRSDRSQDQIDPNTRLVSTPDRSTDQTSLVDQTGLVLRPVW